MKNLLTVLIATAVTKQAIAGTVQAGACIRDEGLVRCALEATTCDDPTDFVSSRLLHHSKEGFVGRECLEEVETLAVGRCPLDDLCTGTANSCTDSKQFKPGYPGCTMMVDATAKQSSSPTLYGACANPRSTEMECRWDRSECSIESGQFWVPAKNVIKNKRFGRDCTCDLVKTGACIAKDKQTYCAVSADACDDEANFVPANLLEGRTKCTLCASSSTYDLPSTLSTPTPAPSSNLRFTTSANPTATPVTPRPGHTAVGQETIQNGTKLVVGIVIGIVAACLVGTLLGSYYVFWYRSRDKASTEPSDPKDCDNKHVNFDDSTDCDDCELATELGGE